MITEAILKFFADLIAAAVSNLSSYDASGIPSMPPYVVDFLVSFGVIFGPGLLVVLAWRVLAYFLPGGAG